MIFSGLGRMLAEVGNCDDQAKIRTLQRMAMIETGGDVMSTYRDPEFWDCKISLIKKLGHALQCIYCVSTWISIVVFSVVQIVTYEPFNWFWFVLGLFASIGITYLAVLLLIIVQLKSKQNEKIPISKDSTLY